MLIKQMCPAFDSPDWIYELKLDGFRCLAYLDKRKRTFATNGMSGYLVNFRSFGILKLCCRKGNPGRGSGCDENGVPDFYELQRRTLLTDPFKIALAAERFPASFVAYDCLFCGEEELLDMPLMQRKENWRRSFKGDTPVCLFKIY